MRRNSQFASSSFVLSRRHLLHRQMGHLGYGQRYGKEEISYNSTAGMKIR